MKVTKENLKLEDGLKREWIITNGLGGYASSTVLGINTRKYHGLLIAPITPPARRYLILSKVDESIKIGDKEYPFFSNIGKTYISKGYEYQTSFEKDILPKFTYEIEDVKIEKTICMEHGKNTVGIYYKIKNGEKDSKLTLAPIVNFRDFHSMNTNHNFNIREKINNKKVRIVIDDFIQTPIYIHASEGKYIEHNNDTFFNMFYIEEEKRGFYPEENHIVPGRYEINIKAGEEKEISFVCSFEENIEEINVKDLIEKEEKRIEKMIKDTKIIENEKDKNNKEKIELLRNLIIATDSFIVYRPSFRLHTIIAGYHWFLDWGRDTLIAFEGLLLKQKRYGIAKEVLKTMVRDIKYGLVPNGYSGFDNRPLYNSVDASLLLFEEVQKYLEYTKDEQFIRDEIYPKLVEIIENYIEGIDVDNNNIYLDSDYLLVSGTETTQNTWMDAKIGDYAVTPRNGKAVEINSMWYNSLMIMADLTNKMGKKSDVKTYKKLAENCKIAFNNRFYNARRKSLYDVLGDSKIRPNQLFAFSLTYPIIDPTSEVAENVINTVEKKLLNPYGLKTLAKGEENYVDIYQGDGKRRDLSYHQGITWTWLLGIYYNTLKNKLKYSKIKKQKQETEEKIKKFREDTIKTFAKEINERGAIGSIAEIYDSKKPYEPKGAVSQGWSVAEILRIGVER